MDAASGAVLATLRGHLGPVNALAYRQDAQELFSAGSDGAVLLWESPLLGSGAGRAGGDGGEEGGERQDADAR